MNKEMIWGVVRHAITVVATAVVANSTEGIEAAISTFMSNIANGDTAAIAGSVVTIVAVLWSIWVKATEKTKEKVIKTMTFRKVK